MAIDPRIANPMIADIAGNAFAPIRERQELNALAERSAAPSNALGQQRNALADYSDAPIGDAQKSASWLRYANQGATRKLPLSDKLVSAISFLPELGVTVEVFSGGQPHKHTGSKERVGSTRHDGGNAADVFLYKDGRRLDWRNPQDRPVFEEIARRGRAKGLSFGAGEGYMQPGSIHLGFGPQAVWGAGGKGENAADWLRRAYYG